MTIYMTPYVGVGEITLQADTNSWRTVAAKLPQRLGNRILKDVGEADNPALRLSFPREQAEQILEAAK
ncbi:MAG: hypothetical protein QM753_16005 [Thermomicrobiales bacterium]